MAVAEATTEERRGGGRALGALLGLVTLAIAVAIFTQLGAFGLTLAPALAHFTWEKDRDHPDGPLIPPHDYAYGQRQLCYSLNPEVAKDPRWVAWIAAAARNWNSVSSNTGWSFRRCAEGEKADISIFFVPSTTESAGGSFGNDFGARHHEGGGRPMLPERARHEISRVSTAGYGATVEACGVVFSGRGRQRRIDRRPTRYLHGPRTSPRSSERDNSLG